MICWSCTLSSSDLNTVESFFWGVGATSVSTTPDDREPIQLQAFFVDNQLSDDAQVVSDLLNELVAPNTVTDMQYRVVRDDGWQERWRDEFEPLKIGDFWVVGEWQQGDFAEPVIRVYPGQAFGTGQHETTHLMLAELSRRDLKGKRMLDVGCGTGILAIAAEKCGASYALGIELDPDCDENMLRHLSMNDCQNVELRIGQILQVTDSFDVVLANITLNALREVWPHVSGLLNQGGVLLSSGLLVEQETQALEQLRQLGAKSVVLARRGEWILVQSEWP